MVRILSFHFPALTYTPDRLGFCSNRMCIWVGWGLILAPRNGQGKGVELRDGMCGWGWEVPGGK